MRRLFQASRWGERLWAVPLLTVSLLVSGYVVDRVVQAPKTVRIAVWFVAAAVLHDAVLFPAYALLDRGLVALHGKWPAQRPALINHIRVPAALTVLFLLIWLPTILGRGDRTFLAASGLHATDELLRWILLSLAFFAASGGIYVIRLLKARRSTKEEH